MACRSGKRMAQPTDQDYPAPVAHGGIGRFSARLLTRPFIITVTSVFLLLDWAAIHDITAGREPDLWMEYATLGFSVFVYALMAIFEFRLNTSRQR